MSTPRNCPKCGLINPPGTTRCDCGHNFDRPWLPNRTRPQSYLFGWCIAGGSLVMSASSTLMELGLPLEVIFRVWYVVVGLAAAVVKPWSWYVVLFCLVLLPVRGGLYIAFEVNDWQNTIITALGSAAITMVYSAYFYKRRAMFGATGRWRRLEQLWPGLIGPETRTSDRVPGFAGLSNPSRVCFVAIVATLILLDQYDAVGRGFLVVILLALILLFVRRVREVPKAALVAFSLLTSAATAHAECAWVLWRIEERELLHPFVHVPVSSFTTKPECQAELRRLRRENLKLLLTCLPDTVDPRTRKESRR